MARCPIRRRRGGSPEFRRDSILGLNFGGASLFCFATRSCSGGEVSLSPETVAAPSLQLRMQKPPRER